MIKTTYSTLQNSDYRPRLGAPLYTAYTSMKKQIEERNKQAYIDGTYESKVFGFIFYSNVIRKEFANEKVRNALSTLSQSKYYRFEVKKLANDIRRRIAQWDSDIAGCMQGSESNLDLYDKLAENGLKDLGYLYKPLYYSIMQVLTKNECKETPLLAEMQSAVILLEYSNKQLLSDIGEYAFKCPALAKLSAMYAEGTEVNLKRLVDILSMQILSDAKDIDLNQDKNITLAVNNIINKFHSARVTKGIITKTFEMTDEQAKHHLP